MPLLDVRSALIALTPRPTVRTCVVRGLRVGVFTEVMAATIDGKPVEDIKAFKLDTADAFAGDISARFEELCRAHPSFNRLRGLQELVALSKALEELDERPDSIWWLEKYPLAKGETPKETKALRREYEGRRARFRVEGGVHLTALAMRLNAGDVTALREAVLKVRPGQDALSWGFVVAEWVIGIGPDQVKPEELAPLFQQAVFVYKQRRYADAITLWDAILRFDPGQLEAMFNKGVVLYN